MAAFGAAFAGAILLFCVYDLAPQPAQARSSGSGPVTHGSSRPSQPRIALTFDACQRTGRPTGFDQSIFNVLLSTHTPATVFLGGQWMHSHISATEALAADPLIELGNHSWSHLDFTRINTATMQAELVKTQDEMMRLTGRKATLFRFPYGRFNARALQTVQATGLTAVQWDDVSGDPNRGDTAQRMLKTVIQRAHDGAIIIMHINGRGWHTAQALPQIIATLKAQGYTFVTISELLQ